MSSTTFPCAKVEFTQQTHTIQIRYACIRICCDVADDVLARPKCMGGKTLSNRTLPDFFCSLSGGGAILPINQRHDDFDSKGIISCLLILDSMS